MNGKWTKNTYHHLGRTTPPYRTKNCPYCKGSGKIWLTKTHWDWENLDKSYMEAIAFPCTHCVDPFLNPSKGK